MMVASYPLIALDWRSLVVETSRLVMIIADGKMNEESFYYTSFYRFWFILWVVLHSLDFCLVNGLRFVCAVCLTQPIYYLLRVAYVE